MEACKMEGLARHIGVSNFSPARLEALIAAAEDAPEVNQVECHPFSHQDELLSVCQKHAVILTAYCPLGSSKRDEEDMPDLFANQTIQEIAGKYQVTPAQIALAWAVCRGTVAIPKSTHKGRLGENLAAAEIRLSAEEISKINALNRDCRFIDGKIWAKDGSPYSLEWLWEGGELG